MGEAERGETAPRQNVTYFCSQEHRTMIAFAVEAKEILEEALATLRTKRKNGEVIF